MKKRRRLCIQLLLLSLGISLVGVGLVLIIFVDPLYNEILKMAMSFKLNSPAYEAWRINDPPLNMDTYLFNWTNPDDIRNLSVKPKFDRIGPYRFLECREKINIEWNDNETISYRHKKTYQFDKNNSVRGLDDLITTINAVPLTLAYKFRDYGYWAKKPVSYSLSSLSSLHVSETAGKILFEGFDDSILGILNLVSLGEIKEKFGLFYESNGTEGWDGSYSMNYVNNENFGSISTWNFYNKTDWFRGHCNDVRGSAGEFYPFYRKRDKITLYSPELCRYAELEYEKDVDVKGILGYKYTARHIFDNGTKRPQNSCFHNGGIVPSGVFNASACRKDSPTFLSFPNFYNADPYYTDIIEGVLGNEERDEFFIVLEPNTGIVIDIAARMQLNMLLQPIRDIGLYENVPKIFIPIFYFDQKIPIRDELVTGIKLLVLLPQIIEIMAYCCMVVGILVICWVGIRILYNSHSSLKLSSDMMQHHEEIPLRS